MQFIHGSGNSCHTWPIYTYTHIIMWYVGELFEYELWTSSHIAWHLKASKPVRLQQNHFLTGNMFHTSLGASQMIINLLRFARSPIHCNCLEHLMSSGKHDTWAANRAGPTQPNISHIGVHQLIHWDQLMAGFFSSQAYSHCAATMVAAAFCGFVRYEGME